jgi:hypothetical protein
MSTSPLKQKKKKSKMKKKRKEKKKEEQPIPPPLWRWVMGKYPTPRPIFSCVWVVCKGLSYPRDHHESGAAPMITFVYNGVGVFATQPPHAGVGRGGTTPPPWGRLVTRGPHPGATSLRMGVGH